MDFSFSEEQTTIRELAREILEAEAPIERVKEAERGAAWADPALWKSLAEANLLGIAVPEAQGGMGMGFPELCVLLEEVGRVVAPGPWLATLVHAGLPLAEFGSDAQKETWLPRLASGDAVLAGAWLDAHSADFAAPATTARADGDGFILDGTRIEVAGAGSAEVILVPAQIDGAVALFLVDPKTRGVNVHGAVGTTGEPLFRVVLEGARVAADARLPGEGAEQLRWLEPRILTAIAAMQAGVSDRAIRITADYTTEREQFGVPIGSFQAVQHRQADSFIDLEAMRWTMWYAAYRLNEGLSAEREARVAKFWAADGGARIAKACVHLHGGLGSDVDYPIQRYFLWSKSLELTHGGANANLAALGLDMAQTGPYR